jgi:SRSO17 transposase
MMSGVAVEDLLALWSAELGVAKARLRPLFAQPATVRSAAAFLEQLLGPERRKTGWMRAEAAGDPGPWRQQAVLGRSSWDADALRDAVRDYALEVLVEPDATLVIDETGFLKQGKASCGVGRQYTGTAGKITNCQVGVFAAYVSSRGHALVDRRLYLPRDWTSNRERLEKTHVPEDVRFATKPVIAVGMIQRAIEAGMPFAWVAADAVYGVGELELALRWAGKGYVLGVASSAQFNSWGKPGAEAVAGTAEEIAKALPEASFVRLSAGEGVEGPRLFDWAYLELADNDPEDIGAPPGLGIWTRGLLVRRRLSDGKLAFFTTWCPMGTPLETLVRVEGRRWAIEDAFETAKTELGLCHNETRSWHGWHRHVSLVMLAFALLAVVRHKADAVEAPQKTARRGAAQWSAGRCRRSVALPAA